MRTATAAGGLVPTGKTSAATETTFNESLLRFYATEETNSRKKKLWTSIPSAWYDSSFWKLFAAPPCLRVIEKKPMQNMTFDPDGSQGRLRACSFWDRGALWFVVRLCVLEKLVTSCSVFWRRFAGSLKQGQPRIRCAGKKSCRRGRLEAA